MLRPSKSNLFRGVFKDLIWVLFSSWLFCLKYIASMIDQIVLLIFDNKHTDQNTTNTHFLTTTEKSIVNSQKNKKNKMLE